MAEATERVHSDVIAPTGSTTGREPIISSAPISEDASIDLEKAVSTGSEGSTHTLASWWHPQGPTWLRNIFNSNRRRAQPPRREIRIRKFNDCGEGYPRLAAMLDSDENFMLYRRFGFLQARLLLYKQDELRILEMRLDRMDEYDKHHRPESLRCRNEDEAINKSRKNLLKEIDEKFNEYTQLLVSARALVSFNRPPKVDYESLKRYFDWEGPLVNLECYINYKEDLITLKSGRESAWLDARIGTILQVFMRTFKVNWFSSKDLMIKSDPKSTRIMLHSRERVDLAVSLLTTVIILLLLIVPVFFLWQLTRQPVEGLAAGLIFGVLSGFTLLFAGALASLTRAKRHEIFATSAAYCAVLVVFMSSVGDLSKSDKA